jgi:hypothetical protein
VTPKYRLSAVAFGGKVLAIGLAPNLAQSGRASNWPKDCAAPYLEVDADFQIRGGANLSALSAQLADRDEPI